MKIKHDCVQQSDEDFVAKSTNSLKYGECVQFS